MIKTAYVSSGLCASDQGAPLAILTLDRDGINLVQDEDSRNVDTVSFEYVQDLVNRAIGLVDGDGSAVQSVFRTDGSDLVLIDVGKRYGVGDRKLQIQ